MKALKLRILGGFQLECDGRTLDEEKLHSRKLVCLLVYLIMNRDRAVSQQRLVDTFWEDNSRKPENALKNMIYRLRNSLRELGEREYICTLTGAYQWNPRLPVETDYEHYEKLVGKLGRAEMGSDTEKQLCREILESYGGNISHKLADEAWMVPKVMLYRSTYTETVKKLCRIYQKEENWKEIELLCNRALTEDASDEEIHCYMMRSLYMQGKRELALHYYQKANRLIYETLGIWNSSALSQTLRELTTGQERRILDMSDFTKSIREQKATNNALFCDTHMFRQLYRMEARRSKRIGIVEYMMLLTIRRQDRAPGTPFSNQRLEEDAEILEEIIFDLSQSGDVVSKLGPLQFGLMLLERSYEESVAVASSIQKKFWENKKMNKAELMCEIAELDVPG